MRKFNINGTCISTKHYMVDTTNKLKQIKKLIDDEEYFTINRGRQYGKTTTLNLLEGFLADEYTVISISFQGLGEKVFASEERFCQEFLLLIVEGLERSGYPEEEYARWKNDVVDDFSSLNRHVSHVCRKSNDKKYVLMIDEVDKTSNNVVFLNFLGKLREKYLLRNADKDFTFHSVILASVYDIKNIKLRLVQEGLHTAVVGETTINNSPWNIATDFKVDMSFSAVEIETMLIEYENDHQIGMDISAIAQEIYDYTSGYPVLVSSICKYIDEEFKKDWTVETVRRAVRMIMQDDTLLFDSLDKNLDSNKELSHLVRDVLLNGGKWTFSLRNPAINLGYRYGYFTNVNSRVKIANKIFELIIMEHFSARDQLANLKTEVKASVQSLIIQNGKFNMQACLERFAKYYHEHYSDKDGKFIEKECRYFFLFFLNSILNGSGFAHIESAFTDDRRMDIVVNYLDEQFIVELKIWKGDEYDRQGHDQLRGYMEKKSLDTGYLLTFDFRVNKKPKQEWMTLDDGRQIYSVRI